MLLYLGTDQSLMSLRGAPSTLLRAGSGDAAISFRGRDCFAALTMTTLPIYETTYNDIVAYDYLVSNAFGGSVSLCLV